MCTASCAVANALGPDRMTAFEYVMSNGGAAYNGAGSAQQQEQHQPAQQQEQPQQQPPPAVLSASISNASSEVGARNSPIIKMPPRVAAKQQLRCASMLHALKAKHSGGQSPACASRAAVPAYRYPVHFFYPPPSQGVLHPAHCPFLCVCSWMGTGSCRMP